MYRGNPSLKATDLGFRISNPERPRFKRNSQKFVSLRRNPTDRPSSHAALLDARPLAKACTWTMVTELGFSILGFAISGQGIGDDNEHISDVEMIKPDFGCCS